MLTVNQKTRHVKDYCRRLSRHRFVCHRIGKRDGIDLGPYLYFSRVRAPVSQLISSTALDLIVLRSGQPTPSYSDNEINCRLSVAGFAKF